MSAGYVSGAQRPRVVLQGPSVEFAGQRGRESSAVTWSGYCV
jgi:hypothetical protein